MVKKAKVVLPLLLSLTSIFCVGYAGWTLSGTGVSTSVNASVGDVIDTSNYISYNSVRGDNNSGISNIVYTDKGFANEGIIGNTASLTIHYQINLNTCNNAKLITNNQLVFKVEIKNSGSYDLITNSKIAATQASYGILGASNTSLSLTPSVSNSTLNIASILNTNGSTAIIYFGILVTFTVSDYTSIYSSINVTNGISLDIGAYINVQ